MLKAKQEIDYIMCGISHTKPLTATDKLVMVLLSRKKKLRIFYYNLISTGHCIYMWQTINDSLITNGHNSNPHHSLFFLF